MRKKRKIPGLNTTSTADISFMLLIFFLVTTSMDRDKGLPMRLPPPDNQQEQVRTDVKERNILDFVISEHDSVTCNNKPIKLNEITNRAEDFIANADNRATLPEKSWKTIPILGHVQICDRHVISINCNAKSSYNTYFAVLNELIRAYNDLRDKLAVKRFGMRFNECSRDEQDAIRTVYPQKISEEDVDASLAGMGDMSGMTGKEMGNE
jgi:biopolymer transport protein ExbD